MPIVCALKTDGEAAVIGLDLRLVCDMGLNELCANTRTPDDRPEQFSDGADIGVAYRALVAAAKDCGWQRSESGVLVCPACLARQRLDEVGAKAKASA